MGDALRAPAAPPSGVARRLRTALARPALPAVQHLAEIAGRLRDEATWRLRDDFIAVGRVRRKVRIMPAFPGLGAAFAGDVIAGEITGGERSTQHDKEDDERHNRYSAPRKT